MNIYIYICMARLRRFVALESLLALWYFFFFAPFPFFCKSSFRHSVFQAL